MSSTPVISFPTRKSKSSFVNSNNGSYIIDTPGSQNIPGGSSSRKTILRVISSPSSPKSKPDPNESSSSPTKDDEETFGIHLSSNPSGRQTCILGTAPLSGAKARRSVLFKSKPIDELSLVKKHLKVEEEVVEEIKPNYNYQFSCSGKVNKAKPKSLIAQKQDNLTKVTSVEWNADFDYRIENYIYPSLQYSAYLEEQERIQKEKSRIKTAEEIQFEKFKKKDNNQPQPFVQTTEKWKAKVTEFDINKSVDTKSTKDEVLDDIDHLGEVHLRRSMREAHYLQLQRNRRKAKEERERAAGLLASKDVVTANKHMFAQLISSEALKRKLSTVINENSPEKISITSYQETRENAEKIRARNARYALDFKKERANVLYYNSAKATVDAIIDPSYRYESDGLIYYCVQKQIADNKLANVTQITGEIPVLPPLDHVSGKKSPMSKKRDNRGILDTDTSTVSMFDSNPSTTSGPSQWEAMVINPGYLMRTKQAFNNHINGYDITKIIQETSLYDGIQLRGDDAMFQSDENSLFLEGDNSVEMSIRNSQDLLLYEQIRDGSLPEFILKPKIRDDKSIEVNMSNMGIGDKQGVVLAQSLQKLKELSILNLHNNRLTSASIPTLFRYLPSNVLSTLNLSTNKIDGAAVGSLARFLHKDNVVENLNLSNCNLQCSDIVQLDSALTNCGTKCLKKIWLTSNSIKHDGCQVLANLLAKSMCTVDTIDLGWNTVGSVGAVAMATALKTNTSLLYLDLAANAVDDIAAQRIGAALATNFSIKEIYLSQNIIKDSACFVFSKFLKDHPSIMKLDLSINPVGEAGARSLFRLILKGLRTFVMMRNCSYKHDSTIFDFENPSYLSPYTLDLSEPYKAAVLFELTSLAINYPDKCKFDNILYRENPKAKDTAIAVVAVDGTLCLKGTTQKWIPPIAGIMVVNFSYSFTVPTLAESTSEKSIKIFEMIVTLARSEIDRKQWVDMMTKDISATTSQLQGTIDRFKANGVIGAGGLRVIDVITNIWSRILDSENCFDFISRNLDKASLRQLKHIVSFDNFKFNWKNPTGHYRIELHNPSSRIILLKLLAINEEESNYSKNLSKRNDTSQKGNWYNFRNELFNTRDNEIAIDAAFVANLPKDGLLEFDYVSTFRPVIPAVDVQDSPDNSDDEADAANAMMSSLLEKFESDEKKQRYSATTQVAMKPIDEDQLYDFLLTLNLTRRHRISELDASYTLLDLQLASAKYYFTANNVNHILDCFPDSVHTQAKVVIVLFSRIWDLHNFDMIMRNLHNDARNEIILRLGWLNVGNPLKPAGEYTIPLSYLDGRIFLLTLLEMDQLNGDQIRDTPKSEIPIISLYGGLNRLKTESKPEKVTIIFAELGAKIRPPNWIIRVEKLERFLICTNPIHKEVFLCIRQYKEMAKSGSLGNGPIDLQYMQHIKQISRSRIASRNTSFLKSRERRSAQEVML